MSFAVPSLPPGVRPGTAAVPPPRQPAAPLLAAPLPLALLAARLTGRVVAPGEAGYEALSAPFNAAVAVRPRAVVEAVTAQDVVEAVRFAGRHGVEIAVQGTGHGAVCGHEEAILVATARLDECVVDPQGRARVGAGVRWQRVLDAAAEHGLAPLAGSSPTVGVVGYLTGGGIGPVARTFGVASDRVRAFDVVTGDGVLRRATPTENPDLFWGLRGGKGALGIVTAVEFDLVPLRTLLAGALYFEGEDAAAVLSAWRTWCPGLPLEATTSVALLRLPPLPGVPEPLAGRLTVAVRFAWTGDPAAGESVLAPMRSAAEPILDGVGPLPYASLAAIHGDPTEPMPSVDAHVLLDALPQEAIDRILRLAGPGADCPQVVVELRQLGGAIAAPPELPSAVCARDAAFGLMAVGVGAPPVADLVRSHGAALLEAMGPWSSERALANFAPGDENLVRVYDAETRGRLAALAVHHDPHRILAAARGLHALARLAG